MEKYLINVEYRVNSKWYTDPLEVLKTNLHFNTQLDSYEIKSIENIDGVFTATVKLITHIDKSALRDWFIGHSTRAEEWIIL